MLVILKLAKCGTIHLGVLNGRPVVSNTLVQFNLSPVMKELLVLIHGTIGLHVGAHQGIGVMDQCAQSAQTNQKTVNILVHG